MATCRARGQPHLHPDDVLLMANFVMCNNAYRWVEVSFMTPPGQVGCQKSLSPRPLRAVPRPFIVALYLILRPGSLPFPPARHGHDEASLFCPPLPPVLKPEHFG